MPFFYISFCDPEKPKGQQFLGATVVEAADLIGAIPEAWKRGVNPGGEAAIVRLPIASAADLPPAGAVYLNHFIPREQVMADDPVPMSEAGENGQDPRCTTVCPDHNHNLN